MSPSSGTATASISTSASRTRTHASAPSSSRQVWRGGRTFAELERLTGLSQNYLLRALGGRFVPTLDRLRVIARALEISVHELAVEMDITDPPALLPRAGRYPQIPTETVSRTIVARKTGLDITYVSRILSKVPGQRRQPRPADLAILAKHFKCSMDHLIACWKL